MRWWEASLKVLPYARKLNKIHDISLSIYHIRFQTLLYMRRTIQFSFLCNLLLGLSLLFNLPIVQADTTDSLQQETLTEEQTAQQETTASDNSAKSIYRFDLSEPIFPAAWYKIKKALDDAEAKNVDYFIMRLNTYGGAVDMADSIRTRLLRAKPTVAVLIDNNAASAGALIALSCDSIFMVDGAQIGAATVVDQTGTQMPDKYQSYMRATMRSTAEMQGRNPTIAEAMVDDRIKIPGIIDSSKTLTFTTSEAIKHGYCEGKFTNMQAVMDHMAKDAKVYTYKRTFKDDIVGFLLNPIVSGLLMAVIFMGIYAEVQSPGVGFPIMAAMSAATLYFLPNYIEGLAENWEIMLFLVGIGLLAVEILVIPGTGITGIMGLVCIIAGLTMSMLYNDALDFSNTDNATIYAKVTQVLISIIGSFFIVLFMGERFVDSRAFRRVSLESEQLTEDGYTIKDDESAALVGKKGVAITDLRTAGRIEIGDERYEAITTGEFIDAGTPIVVKDYRVNYLVVQTVREKTEESDTEKA